jgi:ABC-type dipeptide/oligopeptide/nickel transport system permease subunit
MSAASIAISYNRSEGHPDTLWRRVWASGRVRWGGGVLLGIFLMCVVTLPWTMSRDSSLYYDAQKALPSLAKPSGELKGWFGSDLLGRSVLARCLTGGAISMLIGVAAAAISVVLGLAVGLIAGFKGGWVDSALMRFVDILYGLPYFLLIILLKVACERPLTAVMGSPQAANLVVLFAAIGLVSWLTMARVVRGQVLSLRSQPFIEAARAMGLPPTRIFLRHILPNLVGPVIVYATLIIPQAILQESFLSFLGVGINPPLPTWGSLAGEAREYALSVLNSRWWLLVFPCIMLGGTLLCLNFLGDGLRDVFDPKREAAKL